MSSSRDYYSITRSSKRSDSDDCKREERLPSLRLVVGEAYDSRASSPYDFHDVKRSLPHVPHDTYNSHSGYDRHGYPQRGPTLAPIYSESSPSHGAYTAYQGASHSTRSHSHHVGIPPTTGSSRSNADYPLNHGHSFQTFYKTGGDLVPVSVPSTRPQGVIRVCDLPDEDYDPKKKYKCPECGKGFDRPSGLDQHQLRHTGDKPFPCTVRGCDKSFSVRSNMTRHVRTQHYGEDDADPSEGRYSTYSAASRGSSDKSSPPSGTYYSSSRIK